MIDTPWISNYPTPAQKPFCSRLQQAENKQKEKDLLTLHRTNAEYTNDPKKYVIKLELEKAIAPEIFLTQTILNGLFERRNTPEYLEDKRKYTIEFCRERHPQVIHDMESDSAYETNPGLYYSNIRTPSLDNQIKKIFMEALYSKEIQEAKRAQEEERKQQEAARKEQAEHIYKAKLQEHLDNPDYKQNPAAYVAALQYERDGRSLITYDVHICGVDDIIRDLGKNVKQEDINEAILALHYPTEIAKLRANTEYQVDPAKYYLSCKRNGSDLPEPIINRLYFKHQDKIKMLLLREFVDRYEHSQQSGETLNDSSNRPIRIYLPKDLRGLLPDFLGE